MYATIVKLDTLADAIRAATKNHYFRLVRRLRLTFIGVGRIEIGSRGRELGGTGIDTFEHRPNSIRDAPFSDHIFFLTRKLADTGVRKALAFQQAQPLRIQTIKPFSARVRLFDDKVRDLHQKPGIDAG